MMREVRVQSGLALGVVMVLAAALGASARAEEGRPSRAALSAMGLGSLAVMSDEEALSVRGQGYKGGGGYKRGGSSVFVFGNSFATINGPNGGAHSENGYTAEGKHKAAGSNSSYAGVKHTKSGGHKGGGGYGNKSRGGYGQKSRGNKGGGGGYGGGGGGGGYGGAKVKSTVFFAGGHSSAWAR